MTLQGYAVFRLTGDVELMLIDTLFASVIALTGVGMLFSLQRYSGSYLARLSTRVVFMVLITSGVVYLQYKAVPFIYDDGFSFYNDLLTDTILIRALIAFSLVSFFSAVFWLIYFIKRNEAKNRQKLEAENTLRDAELIMLRQQLQPHFLFNSLNSINSLVITEPKKAREMILNLSDFLRGTLKEDESKTVLLSEEMSLLRLYLEIEKVRFGHRLLISIDLERETDHMKMPPLLLQPVVENAIKFGLYNLLESVEIIIKTRTVKNQLEITISNPFDASTLETKKGAGFGLSLIQKRLLLLYRRADLLKTSKTGSVFTTTILIPQI